MTHEEIRVICDRLRCIQFRPCANYQFIITITLQGKCPEKIHYLLWKIRLSDVTGTQCGSNWEMSSSMVEWWDWTNIHNFSWGEWERKNIFHVPFQCKYCRVSSTDCRCIPKLNLSNCVEFVKSNKPNSKFICILNLGFWLYCECTRILYGMMRDAADTRNERNESTAKRANIKFSTQYTVRNGD